MVSLFIAVRALIFAAAFMGFWFWVIGRLRPLGEQWNALLPAWVAVPGILLAASGAAGVLICIGLFVVYGRGTPALFDAPRRFVALGPYRWVRNPMYVSALAVFAGCGLYWRSVAVLVFSAAWFALIHAVVVAIEEPGLVVRFGETYEEYCRRVPRWIPRAGAAAFVILLLTLTPAGAQTAKPDFSGTWVLDLTRSRYEPFPAPDTRVDVVEHRDPEIKVIRRDVIAGEERTGKWQCEAGKAECTNTIRGTRMTSRVEWEDGVLVVRSQTDFQGQPASIVDRWTLSPDRRTLTIARRASSPAGSIGQTFVFDRR
jgi:protein-S-isoprenylcysteine O-methyltransferase Ste14